MKRTCVMITGASRGIGKAVARAFAAKGHDLILTCRNSSDALEELTGQLKKEFHISCYPFVGDMGDFDSVGRCFSEIETQFQVPDILINNAGISRVGLMTDLSSRDWDEVMQTNVKSVFNCCRHAVPHMVRKKSGSIVNISSVWGSVGASCETVYSASKGAVNAFTMALAKELAPSNISVNAVACGAIDTAMNDCFSDEEKAALCEEIPAGRFGKPSEVASLILSLTEQSSYLTGQIIRLDGGFI